jgi:plasmid stabilization system protein ParE
LRLAWQGEARRELREAVAYYRDQAGLDIAQDFKIAAMRAAERLLDYPGLGPDAERGTRRSVVHDYPYTLIYRVTPEVITIIAVAHQSRRPAYWAGRR